MKKVVLLLLLISTTLGHKVVYAQDNAPRKFVLIYVDRSEMFKFDAFKNIVLGIVNKKGFDEIIFYVSYDDKPDIAFKKNDIEKVINEMTGLRNPGNPMASFDIDRLSELICQEKFDKTRDQLTTYFFLNEKNYEQVGNLFVDRFLLSNELVFNRKPKVNLTVNYFIEIQNKKPNVKNNFVLNYTEDYEIKTY